MESNLIRRGEIIGKRVGGEPMSEAEHYMKCNACGGYFDMRDLGNVFEHEGPLPHPAQDLSDAAERIHPDSRFGAGA
jgi:hypothetical protein